MSLEKILTFPIKLLTGEESGDNITLTLKSKELSNTSNYIIHRAYLTQLYNERQGNANTLTRSEVRGGGRKPWKQKGTGRARAGSKSSPLWKGGGVSFGPKPKLYSNKINRKEWQLGLRNLLIAKQKDITIINNFSSTNYKTNDIIKALKVFNIKIFEKTLIIVPKIDEKLLKSTRNIKTIKLIVANNLNIKQILLAKNLFITKDSLKTIEETYNG
uniref:Large ribosomal subunit protein uL4c n=1 Tax=Desmarestia aculeata TaxID=62298 RepID=A0A8F0FAT9_9PHAE|nr:50S ribosomal protein L4 [Desmarestia aculeata]QWK43709.1 ribosomal protein L4 [Desmarestia aculeata]WAM62874.1 50S ribosomal protein L4 [Desmarestia aculeata]